MNDGTGRSHAVSFFEDAVAISQSLSYASIEKLAGELDLLRSRKGRLFFIGVGGSAGNCSHAVNDFRKLCGIEAYAAADNVSELTARANDEGWNTIFSGWLEVSHLSENDAIFVLSVGGGDVARNVSVNIVEAVDLAKRRGAKVFGIVGNARGHTAANGDVVIVVPAVNPQLVTPLSEAFQAMVWHCLVSHPILQIRKTKW
ncbi:sugar isomerase [Labrys miyagiensis]|uniref:Sugar isomerase n=1 Tax=Labrys miyagiensis TaxID=346912 RepID=A0ABQ6CSI8_9HYPH|nr:SIS domain-containing protein [Labrys miyagiensis]GLS22699.1 sugar isomerase [Labrys miyagiensis]